MNDYTDSTVEETTEQIETWWKSTLYSRVLRFGWIPVLFIVLYFVVEITKPLYTVEAISMFPKEVYPSGSLQVNYNFSLNKKCERREVTKYLVSEETGESHVLSRHFGTLGDGPTGLVNKRTTEYIPEHTIDGRPFPPGKYRYQWTVHAVCDPFDHAAHYIYQDGYIEVL